MTVSQDVVSSLSILTNIVIAIFCVAAVPFALKIISKLSVIETTIKNNEWHAEAISKLKDEIYKIQIERASCPNCRVGLPSSRTNDPSNSPSNK